MATFTELMAEIDASGTPVGDESNLDDETLDQDLDQDAGDEGTADNEDDSAGDDGFDPNAITDPALRDQLVRLQRQMQAGFTPKLQAAAELQRQFGDLDAGVVDAVRQYQSLLQGPNPAAAIDFLAQQQAYLQQQLGLQKEEDPFANIQPLTETEDTLVNVARQMWQTVSGLKRENQQLQLQRQQEAGERQFAQIETKYKTQIPLEEKQQVWNYMRQSGIQDAEAAWKILNFDKATQIGKQKAAETVKQKKKAPPVPTNKQQRQAPGPKQSNAKGLSAHFDEAWSQFSGN